MTTALDAKIASKVIAALTKYGTDAVIEQPINPRTAPGVAGILSDGTQTMTRKISPPAPVRGFLQGTDASAAGDMEAVLAASGLPFVPLKTHAKLTHGGVKYAVVDVVPIVSGDDVAAYTLRLRR